MTIAIALPGIGTSEARIDPNRYGLRTVNLPGGNAATAALRFTVRPVIVLVVDGDGHARELWTNVLGRPMAADLAAVRVRLGSVRGAELALDGSLRAAAAVPLRDAMWGKQGRIWRR